MSREGSDLFFYRLVIYVSGAASIVIALIGIVAAVGGVWAVAVPALAVGVFGFEYSYRGLRKATPPAGD